MVNRTRVTWQSVYDRLWVRFKAGQFKFEDVLEVVYPDKKRFSGREVKYASKLLNEMEDNAYMITARADYDQRVNIYQLLSPDRVTQAWGVYSTWHKKGKPTHLQNILKEVNKHVGWGYMYIKDSAVGFHTNYYRSVEVHHISVLEEEWDGWVSLFKLYDYPIILNGRIVAESKSISETIHFHTDLGDRPEQEGMSDLHVQPHPYTIIECLEDGNVLDALAVLVRKKPSLDWDRLTEAAKAHGVVNTLGFCMETLNREAGKEVFSVKLLSKIKKYIKDRTQVIGEKPELGVSVDLGYQDLEKKWNVKCYQAEVFEKIVLDKLS